jgi:GNAT superfamily N-acetyltransferase
MPITLRAATRGDVPLVRELIEGLAEYEKLRHECHASDTLLERALFGPRAHAEVVIAERDGAAAGFALYFHNFSTFLGRRGLYLEDLFVRPAARGRGVGRALLAALARVAVERRCGRMEWAVLDWNAPAIAFYQSLGARPLDEWTVFRLTGDALAAVAALAPGDADGTARGA